MKSRQATAARYAKALFSIAREAGTAEPFVRELEQFAAELRASRELEVVLLRPWIKPAERQAVAAEVARRAGCSPLVQKTIGLVAARGRMDHLPELVEAYRRLVDDDAGRVRAGVRAAVAFTAAEKSLLAARLGQALGKQVIIGKPWILRSWADSSPRWAASYWTAVSTGSWRGCASASQGDRT